MATQIRKKKYGSRSNPNSDRVVTVGMTASSVEFKSVGPEGATVGGYSRCTTFESTPLFARPAADQY